MFKTLIIVIIILFLIVVLGYFQKKYQVKTLRKLNESRPILTRSEYINLLVKRGFDKHHVEVVHDKIRELIDIDNYSIYPKDDIHTTYAIDDLEDIEFIDGICKELKLREPNQNECNQLNKETKIFNAEYILTLIKNLAEDKTLLT